MKILVIGANGMIGAALTRVLSEASDWQVYGTVRNEKYKRYFSENIVRYLISGVDVERSDLLPNLFDLIMPDVVINCAGLTKHKQEAENQLVAIPINTLVPHRLAALCKLSGSRLIHISTDCVFSGLQGNYTEDDFADARDVYGRSKVLGEVICSNAVTLRTSTIGHEFYTKHGLLEWFLAQQGVCKGYSKAIFSGLPTVAFAEIIRDFVIPNPQLSGLYHVAASAINKFDLLCLIAEVYGKNIVIERDDKIAIDRSLNALRFQNATGYVAPAWVDLVKFMHANR